MAKRICRFSAAAPSAQCIESPRSHLILDNKPHTRTKSRGLQTTPRQFTQEEGRGRDRRITRRSFPTNRPTSRTQLARGPHNPHDTSTAAPSAENKEFPRKTPPMLHTPTPTEDRLPSLNQPHPPCTRPQIFNQRPSPVDYDQSSSLLGGHSH